MSQRDNEFVPDDSAIPVGQGGQTAKKIADALDRGDMAAARARKEQSSAHRKMRSRLDAILREVPTCRLMRELHDRTIHYEQRRKAEQARERMRSHRSKKKRQRRALN